MEFVKVKGFILFITTAFLFVGIFFMLFSDINSEKNVSKTKPKATKVNFEAYAGNKGLTMHQIDSVTAKYNYSFTKFNDPFYSKTSEEPKKS